MKKLLLFLIIIPLNVFALTLPEINSKYAFIYDKTDDKVLFEKNSNEKTYIASLTKIATTITAIENINNLNEEVVITNDILNTVSPIASIAGLKVGDKLTYKDLLYASMVPSGADATNSLAILSSGSIENFVSKMNELANKINLTDTHFVNVTGLDIDNHYSTANDLGKLLSYALDNEIFREVFTTKDYTLSNGLKVKSTLYIYNKKLNSDLSPILGSKTGYTKKAGYSIATLSNTSNHEIIMILLNAPFENQVPYHIIDDLKLINFMNKNFNNQVLFKKGTLIKEIPVNFSNIDSYKIEVRNNIVKFLPNDYDRNLVSYKYEGLEELNFNNRENEIIGEVSYYYDDKLVSKEEIRLEEVLKISYIKILKHYYYIFIIIFVLLLLLITLKVLKKENA